MATNIKGQNAEELRKLSKSTLIKMATSKIQDSSFSLTDFDKIEIWKDDDDLTVEFDHAIRFIPMKGQFYYSATVNLVTGSPIKYIMGEGPVDQDVTFYKPAQFETAIQFVIDAINASGGDVGKIPKGELPDGYMTINENEGYYDVTVDSESTHSYYKIRKDNGKIYDSGHKHYLQDGEGKRQRIY